MRQLTSITGTVSCFSFGLVRLKAGRFLACLLVPVGGGLGGLGPVGVGKGLRSPAEENKLRKGGSGPPKPWTALVRV